MKTVIRTAWRDANENLEGWVHTMYVDSKNLVTVGMGNLLDNEGTVSWGIQSAQALPFIHRMDSTPASKSEIEEEWWRIKRSGTAKTGWTHAARVAQLCLKDSDIQALVDRKLTQNDITLTSRFAEFQDWPADAQMAIHSMAWAAGPFFRYPLMEAFLKSRKFANAAEECDLDKHVKTGTIPLRNAMNKLLLRNAATVELLGGDPDVMHWPNQAKVHIPVTADQPIVHRPDSYFPERNK